MVNRTSLSRARYRLPLLTLLALFVVNAQSVPPGPTTKLVVLVDGAKNPEQIPDDLAYRHFLVAVATHEKPSAEESGRQKAQLAPLGLAEADRQQLAAGHAHFSG